VIREIEIAGRRIGAGHPVFVVAELSANHGGSLDHAIRVLRAAAECGADAVKIQTYTPDTLTIDCDAPPFVIGPQSPWTGRTLFDLYREAHTPWEWHPRLKEVAEEAGLVFFSTPFDATAVDFLEGLGVPAMKIASFEIGDLALVERVARTGKPIVLSTGMAGRPEITDALATARAAGNGQVVLLKCTSAYPAPPESMNLRAIPWLSETFRVPAGLSDHTLGTAAPVAAVALGACLVEKHFCLSRSEGGPDSAFSLEPSEFQRLVEDVRSARAALGRIACGPSESERGSTVFRRSLFIVRDVKAGEPLTPENVRAIRPGHGLPPRFLPLVLRRRAAADAPRGTPLTFELLGGPSS
jgi:N-acetylneuraminate synthase